MKESETHIERGREGGREGGREREEKETGQILDCAMFAHSRPASDQIYTVPICTPTGGPLPPRRAYRTRALMVHPDKAGGSSWAEERGKAEKDVGKTPEGLPKVLHPLTVVH